MGRTPDQGPRRARLLVLLAALTVVLLVAVVAVRWWGGEDPSPAPQDPSSPTSSETTPHEGAAASEKVSLTVPETVRTSAESFPVAAGERYLLRFDVSTVKPAGSPGSAMYFGVSLSCAGPDGVDSQSIGGTQNILPGEPVTLSNQFLYSVSGGGERTCRVAVSSPHQGAAATGTTVEVEVDWSATSVDDSALAPDSSELLPRVIPPGERAPAFVQEVELARLGREEIKVLGTVHVTTCTIVNGSREGDGEHLCVEAETDGRGSAYDVELRVDVIGPDVSACAIVDLLRDERHVDRRTHHQMLSLDRRAELPATSCGDTVRIQLTVDNSGPAPLVVHGMSSSLLVLPGGS